MPKRKDTPTRREIDEKIHSNKETMEKKEIDLDKIASDVETVRRTLENLEFGGTEEGAEIIESTIKSAKDITVDVFDREDQTLEHIHADSHKYGSELRDRQHTSESDLTKVSKASTDVETKETISNLEKAKEGALREIEYFSKQINRTTKAIEKSKEIREKHRSRAHEE